MTRLTLNRTYLQNFNELTGFEDNKQNSVLCVDDNATIIVAVAVVGKVQMS